MNHDTCGNYNVYRILCPHNGIDAACALGAHLCAPLQSRRARETTRGYAWHIGRVTLTRVDLHKRCVLNMHVSYFIYSTISSCAVRAVDAAHVARAHPVWHVPVRYAPGRSGRQRRGDCVVGEARTARLLRGVGVRCGLADRGLGASYAHAAVVEHLPVDGQPGDRDAFALPDARDSAQVQEASQLFVGAEPHGEELSAGDGRRSVAELGQLCDLLGAHGDGEEAAVCASVS